MKFMRQVKRRFRSISRAIRGKYDAAQTVADNRKHWANADALSADAANSASVRRILRNRARYEIANNSYARGIVLTLGNDVIGTGARLQMLSETAADNAHVESEFAAWCAEINLAAKLRTARMAMAGDGETFLLLSNNPGLRHRVKLDVVPFEADRVTTPAFRPQAGVRAVDGIRFDNWGNPIEYHVLRKHPGDMSWTGAAQEFDRVPAKNVLHLFRQDRPEQHRGVPEIMAALPLFAQLRRYTLATLDAAETAANFSGVIESIGAAEDATVEEASPFEEIELQRNLFTTLPFGYKLSQMKAEQPATTYEMFKREILNEIARCLNMPLNIALCNSSGYNYASGRLDHQTYDRSIAVDRDYFALCCLDRILAAWLFEAILIDGFLPQSWRIIGATLPPRHSWFWTNRPHVDPAKEATAQQTRLQNHTTTLAHEYAIQGKDWETELRQRARERDLMKELEIASEAPAAEPVPAAEDKEED